jgi:ferric-dicitrate binding protein FerR (iron transport regulator)
LRLAEGTSVTLAAATRIELESGRAYIDSGVTGAEPVAIVTRLGTVRDIGTQFEARLQDDVLRLRVRSGRVQFSHGGLRYESGAGEQLSIVGDRMVERGSIAATDVDWRWVETLATAPDVDEQPVTRLLDWVARETGRPIRYRDAEVERRAASTILHGSIRHLAPLEALTAMLATTDLEYVELTDGTLLIQSKPTR